MVSSGIVKRPIEAPVLLTREGFAGDGQADREAHGGPDKAACAYPVEHVPAWAEWLGRPDLPPGAFGENLTTTGLLETDVHIGDVFSLGDTVVQISQPRGPCYKLGARWGRKELPARMAHDGISGFYFRVLEEGEVRTGHELSLLERRTDVTVAEVMRVGYRDRHDAAAVQRLLAVPELAEQWRETLVVLAERSLLPLREFGPVA